LRAEASAALFREWNFSEAPAVFAHHDNGGLVSLCLLLQHNIDFASLCLIDVAALSRTQDIPFFLPQRTICSYNCVVSSQIDPYHSYHPLLPPHLKLKP